MRNEWCPRIAAVALAAATTAFPVMANAQRAGEGSTSADIAKREMRADATYAAGDRAGAEREYAAVLALDSTRSHAVFRLAQLRSALDRDGAIALYRRYVLLEPRDAWGHIALADALAASGDIPAALDAYDRAARLEPNERDVHIGRARVLAGAGHTDEAIAGYEQWVARTPRDGEAWRELAAQRRRAGRYRDAIAALERIETPGAGARSGADREIARLRRLSRATVEPTIGASRDADGLTTMRASATLTSPLIGRARMVASASTDRADDATLSRGSRKLAIGLQYRPLAQLQLEVAGGVARADRAPVSTGSTAPITSGPGTGQAPPINRTAPAGTSTAESFPVGRARVLWRAPGDAIGVDARLGRQLLDASPLLVAQGVIRDEASVSLDVRVAGPVRVRGFGRFGSVHNEAETNDRRMLGGALAYAPGSYEVALRAQTMRYGAATALAYFAPRAVETAELTTYVERETDAGTTLALDLGGGGQRVTNWGTASGTWSPSFRGWAQVVKPLGGPFALGTELEAYNSRVGPDAPSAGLSTTRWWYGSASLGLRVTF